MNQSEIVEEALILNRELGEPWADWEIARGRRGHEGAPFRPIAAMMAAVSLRLDGRTLKQAGDEVGCGRERVRQLQLEFARLLRSRLMRIEALGRPEMPEGFAPELNPRKTRARPVKFKMDRRGIVVLTSSVDFDDIRGSARQISRGRPGEYVYVYFRRGRFFTFAERGFEAVIRISQSKFVMALHDGELYAVNNHVGKEIATLMGWNAPMQKKIR